MNVNSNHQVISLSSCWAKTDRDTGQPSISVLNHCLTVGHVGTELSKHLPISILSLLPKGYLTLIAAHDIGKITPGFQLKCPAWEHHQSISASIIADGIETNHAKVSQWHLQSSQHFEDHRKSRFWLMSTGAHHGSYPFSNKPRMNQPIHEGGCELFLPLRDALLANLIEVFGELPTEPANPRKHSERMHLLTGFTILSDWIGSNTDWFPSDFKISAETIQTKTREVISELCLTTCTKSAIPFGEQFVTESQPAPFKPRPIQTALLAAADAPGLYILEAPMGMGKTEAALATAYQRWTTGSERGLYFALPTQLTSNKINDRITEFLRNTIGSDAVQTLIHGNAWLTDDKTRHLTANLPENDPQNPEFDHNDTNEALRWFSSSRKALIAPYGTGTIDQAMLAVLPARFAALRYFALAGKVVVIDEVHSFDPYMSTLIDRLVSYLLKAGSTVIILSATLTAQRRNELVEAAGATEPSPPLSYPLITKVATGSDSAEHFPVEEIITTKTVTFHHYTTADDNNAYWQNIADHVTRGANVVVIRNTVALAQETYKTLKSLLTEKTTNDHTGLVHSRFPQWQRKDNEDLWIDRLGKNKGKRPSGSLLVSTQIVEQSVDIDADLLVTDLAPIELILQRLGRLHRHDHARPSGYDSPTCHILHPPTDWQGSAKEIKEQLAPHHFIYPPLALWQASQLLTSMPAIHLPDEIRYTLESAALRLPNEHDPQGIHDFLDESKQEIEKQIGTAKTRGPFSSTVDDKEGHQTRYGIKPSASLILLKSEPSSINGETIITPVHGDPIKIRFGEFSYTLAKILHQNAVRLSSYLVQDCLNHSPEWLSLHINDAVLAVVPDDRTELTLIPKNEYPPYLLSYNPTLGVTHEKTKHSPAFAEPEDDWY